MKVILIISFFLSIVSEAIYEGLEKKSVNEKKPKLSTIGHWLQMFCFLSLGATGYLLSKVEEWQAINILIIWPFLHFAIFNPIWNKIVGMPIGYAGKTDIFDKLENWFLEVTGRKPGWFNGIRFWTLLFIILYFIFRF